MGAYQVLSLPLLIVIAWFASSVFAFSSDFSRKLIMSDLSDFHFEMKRFEEFGPHLLYSMLRLRSDVFVVEQTCVFLDLDNEDQVCYHSIVTKKDNPEHIIACLRIFPPEAGKKDTMTRIGRVVTDKSFRGKGIARKLMLDAMEYSRKEWPDCPIKVGAQAHLDSFYGKDGLGFRRISEVYDEDGIDHVDMIYP